MFERFTDRARRVLVLAQEEARLLSHGFIGTEHILLGLIHESSGVAAQALHSLGISLEAAREQIAEIVAPAASGPTRSPPFTPRAKKVLELSLREALQLGGHDIGTEHLLLGLVREGEGVGAQVLRRLGADPLRVRREVVRLLGSSEAEPPAIAPLPGRRSVVVGRRWTAEVVRSGRRPVDFAAAYAELTDLAGKLGLDLDQLDASRLLLLSVETNEGPGLRLSITHELPEARDPEARDEVGDGGDAATDDASRAAHAEDPSGQPDGGQT